MTVSVGSIAPYVDRDHLVSRLRELVRTPSENPPGNEAHVAGLVQRWCDELGFATLTQEAEPNRPSVIARWQGERGPTLCYCSHIDVVPAGDAALWAMDPFSAQISEGRMHGRGSSDAKGPIAAALEAVRALKDTGFEPRGTLELALVADEETMGIKGAGYLVEKGILSPDVVIVGEPTSLQIVRAQRGPCWFRIITRGVAAHGSAPERGRSAIKHMAEIISHLEETVPDIEHPILGRPSINVGTIRGGEKVNVVPASCIAEVDRRSLPGETRESVIASIQAAIERATERFPDIDATIELPFFGAPFEVREGSPVLEAIVAASSEVQGREAEVVGFRGSSDARFFAEAGADVVVCGPGDIALAHTARESIDLAELERGALTYAVAFARLLSKPH